MARSYIPVYFDLLEETENLTDQEFGRMIRAAIMYAKGETDYMDQLHGNERFAFGFLRGQIDRNNKISDKRAKAGSSRKGQNETKQNKTEQTATKRNKKSDANPLFDRFWDAYPRHENKQAAMKAFDKAKIDGDLLDKIIAAIERQKGSAQWQESGGQFIPHPATWLNGRRWEDEVKIGVQKKVNAQAYSQRDYTNEDREAMERMIESAMA